MKKIIIIVLISIAVSCKSQIKNSTDKNKTNTMEKFDITFFKKFEKDENYTSSDKDIFYKLNDKRYRIQFYKEIQVEETNINSPNIFYKIYYKNSNHLKSSGNDFYDFPIGITKEYNENVELIKETDYDKDYKFSIEDLQKKMKATYNVDIMDKKQTRSVSRTTIDPRIKFPYYQVLVNSGIASFTDYLLNGNTGEVIYKLSYVRDYEKDTVDEYIKSLKK